MGLAPHGSVPEVLTAWYAGIFQIFPFAFQMVMILVTGYALSSSRPVARGLAALASVPRTPQAAVAMAVVVSMAANLLNWGFGLVVSALFAREIAKRHRLDFAWLMAGAYTGFLMFPPGISSSIALAEATPGSALNITQKITGQIVPLSDTLLTWFNIVPVLVLVLVMPIIFMFMRPGGGGHGCRRIRPGCWRRMCVRRRERRCQGWRGSWTGPGFSISALQAAPLLTSACSWWRGNFISTSMRSS